MKTIAVIIKGIYLPYNVIDYAIEKAKKILLKYLHFF